MCPASRSAQRFGRQARTLLCAAATLHICHACEGWVFGKYSCLVCCRCLSCDTVCYDKYCQAFSNWFNTEFVMIAQVFFLSLVCFYNCQPEFDLDQGEAHRISTFQNILLQLLYVSGAVVKHLLGFLNSWIICACYCFVSEIVASHVEEKFAFPCTLATFAPSASTFTVGFVACSCQTGLYGKEIF